MYCGGMPIMYAVGFVFYLATFVFNKWLILKFYTKSRTLTRTVPLFAVEFLRYGIYLHMIMGFFMMMNPIPFYTLNRLEGIDPLFDPSNMLYQLGFKDTEGPAFKEHSAAEFLRQHLQFFH